MSHFRLPRRITAPVTLPRVVAMLVIAVGVLSFGSIGSAASTSLVINEVDYDQPATDTAEFYELKNVSGAAINLDAYRVELINGNGGALYQVHDLPNVNLAAGDYFVVCANAANTANCDMDVTPDTDLIQNGAPDGLRLMLGLDPTPVDALSYEGDTLGATEGSGAGLNDTAAAAPAVAESISRCPDGADADVNNADFSLRTSSPGAANVCAGPKVVINEVDYDQPGTDTAEFLELKNTSAVAVNLDPYAVELVNGSGGLVYGTIDLPAVSLAGGDYYVICADAATTVNCDLDVTPDSNLIQNGAPDGLRLVSRERLSTRSATKATRRARPRAPAPASRTWPATASRAVPTATTRTPTTSTSRCGRSRRARRTRVRRRRSSSTRSTTTRSARMQPSTSSSRTPLPSRSTSIRTSSSS